jgi:hypothetical protein
MFELNSNHCYIATMTCTPFIRGGEYFVRETISGDGGYREYGPIPDRETAYAVASELLEIFNRTASEVRHRLMNLSV